MKTHIKSLYILIMSIAFIFLTGCEPPSIDNMYNSNSSSSSDSSAYKADSNYKTEDSYQPQQNVIFNSSLTAETKTYKDDHEKLLNLVKDNKGLIMSQDSFQNEEPVLKQSFVQTNFKIKVPKDNYSSLVATLKKDFVIASFNENSLDVTDSKLSSEQQIKLLDEEIKAIEEQLEDKDISSEEKTQLRIELRSLKEQKMTISSSLDDTNESIQYSDIDLTLREVPHYSNEKPSIWYNVRQAFSGFIGNAIAVLAYSLLTLVFFIPFIAILAFARLTTRKMWYKWLQKGINSGKFDIEAIKESKKLD